MGREIEIVENDVSKFDKKMRKPQAASKSKDWKGFKKFFEENQNALLEPFDLLGNSAIHVVTRFNKPRLLRELLEMLSESDRWWALRKKNIQGNTLLHEVSLCINVEMVDVVFNYENGLRPPSEEEINDDSVDQIKRPLLDFRNNLGETPLYRAAKFDNLTMLKYMAKHVDDMRKHLYRDVDKYSILHISVVAQNFGLPEEENQLNDKSVNVFKLKKGLECGQGDNGRQSRSVISRINYGIWKRMAKEWDPIDKIWEAKKQHKLAEKLAELLVKNDISWQNSFNQNYRPLVILPVLRPTNVAVAKKKSDEKKKEKPSGSYDIYTPLLLAASTGIVEIVEKILESDPEAISHVSENQNNVLHMAVKHRQLEIYRILKKNSDFKSLVNQITNQGRTILHQAARMDYFRGSRQPGIAFQLQDELRWYERVKKILHTRNLMHCDDDGLSANEVLEAKHEEMVSKAQDWIKETAESCSTVAVLVATVVFAAAYTIPGGTDTSGLPIFLRSPVFLFFTIMDVVSLASSLASVVMFLSVLTSPFEMWDFYKSLPRKLTLGFSFLFFSLITSMLAFSATILLTIRLEKKKWTSTLIYGAAFFPVTIFAMIQFPIYIGIQASVIQAFKKLKKLVPSSLLLKCRKRFKKRN